MLAMLLLILLVAGCGASGDGGSGAGSNATTGAEETATAEAEETAMTEAEGTAMTEDRSIDAVLERHAERLVAHEGVQGIYVGQNDAGDPCLVILATVPAEELSGVVPDSLEGWPVRIESGDEIRPMH